MSDYFYLYMNGITKPKPGAHNWTQLDRQQQQRAENEADDDETDDGTDGRTVRGRTTTTGRTTGRTGGQRTYDDGTDGRTEHYGMDWNYIAGDTAGTRRRHGGTWRGMKGA